MNFTLFATFILIARHTDGIGEWVELGSRRPINAYIKHFLLIGKIEFVGTPSCVDKGRQVSRHTQQVKSGPRRNAFLGPKWETATPILSKRMEPNPTTSEKRPIALVYELYFRNIPHPMRRKALGAIFPLTESIGRYRSYPFTRMGNLRSTKGH